VIGDVRLWLPGNHGDSAQKLPRLTYGVQPEGRISVGVIRRQGRRVVGLRRSLSSGAHRADPLGSIRRTALPGRIKRVFPILRLQRIQIRCI
jgi:hypothetical protein